MGRFIVIESIDGSGKSTQCHLLCDYLNSIGERTIATFEPSNSSIGVLLQNALCRDARKPDAINSQSLLHLFIADRLEHLKKEVLPALKLGSVVCDRYYYSTYVYQGLDSCHNECDWLDKMESIRLMQGSVRVPDLTIILDVPPTVAMERVRRRSEFSRYEYLEKLMAAYRCYQKLPDLLTNDNIVVIDGSGSAEDVSERVKKVVSNGSAAP